MADEDGADGGSVFLPNTNHHDDERRIGSEEVTPGDRKKRHIYRMIKTGMFVLAWVAQGMFDQITGSAILDLMSRANTDFEGISHTIAVMSISRGIGSLGGGFILDRLRQYDNVITTLSLFLVAVGVVIKPWCGSVVALGLSFVLQGLGKGCLNTAGNAGLVELWKKKSSQPLLIMHSGYPVGAFIVPLIVRPFLGSKLSANSIDVNTTDVTKTHGGLAYTIVNSSSVLPENISLNADMTTGAIVYSRSRIEIPYIIVTAILVLTGTCFLILHCFKPKRMTTENRVRRSWKSIYNPRACADGNLVYGVSMCTLFGLFFAASNMSGQPLQYYLFTFAVTSSLQFSKQDAALLDSMQGVGQAFGRILSAILKPLIPIKILLFANLYLSLGAVVALSFLSLRGSVYVWVLIIFYNTSFSPMWPIVMAWLDRYIVVTGMVAAIADVGSAIGGFICQWISGVILQNNSPISLMYCSWCATAFMCIVTGVMQFLGSYNGARQKTLEDFEDVKVSSSNIEEETAKLNT